MVLLGSYASSIDQNCKDHENISMTLAKDDKNDEVDKNVTKGAFLLPIDTTLQVPPSKW